MKSEKIFRYKKPFLLESGKKLRNLEICYHTFGKLNARKDNVIWVCHALTGSSDVFDWWKGLFGENCLFNPAEHFIICANIIGSGYGSTNPLSINEITGHPYYLSFPEFTVRDLANAHKLLAEELRLDEIAVVIGGSLGGQQALEWAILDPKRIKRQVLIATNAQHSPWGIAFNESQRLAITTDRTFYANHPDGGKKGLKVARSIALLSYRAYTTYATTQLEVSDEKSSGFKAASYQNYQGEKLVSRFNAFSYWYLTKAMDSHNVARKRSSVADVLNKVQASTLVVGIRSDVLFPLEEQEFLAKHIPNANLFVLDSIYGHDGFLVETEILSQQIGHFLKSSTSGNSVVNLHKIA